MFSSCRFFRKYFLLWLLFLNYFTACVAFFIEVVVLIGIIHDHLLRDDVTTATSARFYDLVLFKFLNVLVFREAYFVCSDLKPGLL